MKNIIFYLLAFLLSKMTYAQNVGIGTTSPLARLHVADSSVLFSGPSVISATTSFLPPVQGAGTRLMWYPEKGAFRVGSASYDEWDMNKIGINSIAMGNATTASGYYSTAMGQGTIASNNQSTALGQLTTASGISSTAIGAGATASGPISTAIGYATTAKSLGEIAMGAYNTDYTPIAPNGWNASDRLFSIGNGNFITGNSDAMVILKGGNVGIGISSPAASAQLEVNSTSRGFLPPRLTIAQRSTIINPAVGLVIYCTECDELEIFNGAVWKTIIGTAACVTATLPFIKICDQIWMSKNLDVSNYRNGDPIPHVTDPSIWASLTTGAWCWYNNDSASYAATYGKLYNWYALNDSRGLTPLGWHIPDISDFNNLSTCLGGDAVAGGKMKETGTAHWINPNTGATNTSGFTGLPGGGRYEDGSFNSLGGVCFFWTSGYWDVGYGIECMLYFNGNNLFIGNGGLGWAVDMHSGLSIRCIKD